MFRRIGFLFVLPLLNQLAHAAAVPGPATQAEWAISRCQAKLKKHGATGERDSAVCVTAKGIEAVSRGGFEDCYSFHLKAGDTAPFAACDSELEIFMAKQRPYRLCYAFHREHPIPGLSANAACGAIAPSDNREYKLTLARLDAIFSEDYRDCILAAEASKLTAETCLNPERVR